VITNAAGTFASMHLPGARSAGLRISGKTATRPK
jgi:hypothetical protein